MQLMRLLIIPLSISIFLLNSCKKNMVEETYTPIVTPVIPDFGSTVTTAVNGFITNENGEAVQDATVTAGSTTTTTDQYGYFEISNTRLAKSAGFVQVVKDGYFTGFRTFVPVPRKQTFIRLQLVTKINDDVIESQSGGTVSFNGNASVTLPENATVFGSNNSTYVGPVYVAAHWFDPSDMQNTSLTMPGDLTGVDSAGHLAVLQTFGMVAVELTGTNGQKLKLAPGKKAKLHFPLPRTLQGAAPVYIPLWYFDETKGVWQQEAHAVRNGEAYEGEVSHFSYWNCDIGLPLVDFTAQFVDGALNPLANVPVSIAATGLSNGARIAYTDTNGMVYSLVPANSNLKVDMLAPCNQSIYSHLLNTTNSFADLGTLSVNTEQYSARIEGTVIDCNSAPVTNGYAIISQLGNNAVVRIKNGSFSKTTLICQPVDASVVAVDLQTAVQSQSQQVTVSAGLHNIGELHACNGPLSETINITYNSSEYLYTLPQYLFGGNFYFANDSTAISAIDLLNSNQQVFELCFSGTAVPGIHQLANGRQVYIADSYWIFEAGATVTVSSYGLIGGFILGSLTGTASMASQPGVTRTYNITFTVQRDQ